MRLALTENRVNTHFWEAERQKIISKTDVPGQQSPQPHWISPCCFPFQVPGQVAQADQSSSQVVGTACQTAYFSLISMIERSPVENLILKPFLQYYSTLISSANKAIASSGHHLRARSRSRQRLPILG